MERINRAKARQSTRRSIASVHDSNLMDKKWFKMCVRLEFDAWKCEYANLCAYFYLFLLFSTSCQPLHRTLIFQVLSHIDITIHHDKGAEYCLSCCLSHQSIVHSAHIFYKQSIFSLPKMSVHSVIGARASTRKPSVKTRTVPGHQCWCSARKCEERGHVAWSHTSELRFV